MLKILLIIILLMSDVMGVIRITLQPKQNEARSVINSGQYPYFLYGGAKGGGKSYLVRGTQIERRMTYAGTTGVIIRRTYPELLANHIRKFFVEYPFTREWYRAGEKALYYPNGSITEFKFLNHTDDVYNYQGLEYDDISLDEATQHEGEVIKILKTSLRSDPKVIAKYPDYKPVFLMTGNPGGIGHAEVKRLFIDRDYDENENPDDYYFLQAKIYDNPIFIKANPRYLQNLLDLPEDLRRAYLDGDWDVFIGQFFKDFRKDIHGIEPIEIPEDWGKLFSLDWGYSPHPYHAGWYAQDFSGNVLKYREIEGVETPPDEVGEIIGKMSKMDKGLRFGVGDTQMWALNPFAKKKGELGSDKSIAMRVNLSLSKYGLVMLQANKDRFSGWTHLRSMLKWDADRNPDATRHFIREPKYRIFNTCPITLSAYPQQIHSKLRPEDMLKQDGDDPCDTDRYALMYIQKGHKPEPPPKPKSKRDAHLEYFKKIEEMEGVVGMSSVERDVRKALHVKGFDSNG